MIDSTLPSQGRQQKAVEEAVTDVREVKVKLPVKQILHLHYARMKQRKNFSEIVSTALTRYLDELAEP